jgi:glycerophosphoryl diester phosphodiesterase
MGQGERSTSVWRSSDGWMPAVEVANYATPTDRLPETVVGLILRYEVSRRILISSFNPIALWKIRRLMPMLPLGLLMTPMQPAWQRRLFPWLAPHGLWHPFETMITESMVRRTHRQGKWLMAWTVNDRRRMEELVDWGVDALITDMPDVAREVADGC